MENGAAEGRPGASRARGGPDYGELQRRFDELVEGGASRAARERFLEAVFIEHNRAIRNLDFHALRPATVAEDYLLPRRDLMSFVLGNWIREVFLPTLPPCAVRSMLVFGVGRLFSSYNDTGVQHGTDADINVVVADGLPERERRKVQEGLERLRAALLERFRVHLEIDPEFTLLRAREAVERLSCEDAEVRARSLLFYKSNCRSLRIIKDEEELRESLFSRVRRLPDALLFENFLGLSNPKPTFMRIRTGRAELELLADGSLERIRPDSAIGSRAFARRLRRALPPALRVSPPDWHFSMKHMVNRVYDYVGAMRDLGYGLGEIGFDRPSPELGADPDYRYLRDAHRLMLYLQELVQITAGHYGEACDYSYVSRARFSRFCEIDGDKFRSDFERMVLGGDLLLPSEKEVFRTLRRKIEAKARDRFLEGRAADFVLLPEGLAYETVYRDPSGYKLLVPYSWADLGYFVFDSMARRMAAVVEGRLVPRLGALGLPPEGLAAYRAACADGDGEPWRGAAAPTML